MKAIFSTGEAAEICQVSQQTIIRCFDSGKLKGFKVPGSRFRRIPRAALMTFMKEHGIPMDALDSGKTKVLVIGDSATPMVNNLRKDGKLELKHAASGYEAGMLTQDFLPDVIVLGILESPAEQLAICRSIRSAPDLQHIRIYVAGKLSHSQSEHLNRVGISGVIDPGITADKFLEQIETVAA